MKPVLHVSGMFGANRHNIALVVPLAVHPHNRNEIICFDLSADPQPLFDLPAEKLQELLYMRTEDLPPGTERLGFKSIHINRCPILLTPKMADPATAQRLGISGELCRKHLDTLRQYRDREAAQFTVKVQAVCGGRNFAAVNDPDLMLYGGGFFSEPDKRTMEQVRAQTPEELAVATFVFEDKRLPEMLFRYRARNYPDSLSPEEHAAWEEYRFQRLTEPDFGAGYCMEEFQADIETLSASGDLSATQQALMEQLLDYADTLLA
jgi:exodeoxyribonuclease-1